MITICCVCPHCGRENNGWGANRFWGSPANSTIHLKATLCYDCYKTVQIAREHQKLRGMWALWDQIWRPEPGEWR